MRLKTLLTLTAAFVAFVSVLHSAPAAAGGGGGEDWPHFCQMSQSAGGVDSFRIHPDDTMPLGYGLELLSGGDTVDYLAASLKDTDDSGNQLPYYQVFATGDYGVLNLRERQVLLYVQKDSTKQSTGDVEITLGDNATFDLKPMDCGGE